MTSLFFETFIIQLFVGMLFLMLGIWAGRYLFAGMETAAAKESPSGGGGADEKITVEKTLEESEKAIASLKDESRQLRLLNERLEQELRLLKEKTGKEEAPAPDEPVEDDTKKDAETPAAAKEETEKKVEKVEDAQTAEPDDLLQIRGIGKVMGEKLEKRGIITYRQIAEWSKEDIAKLPFKSRVTRDKWQTQARRLHKDKYGEKLQ